MVHVKTQTKTKVEQLAALYQLMQANNDEDNAGKMMDLYHKLHKEELIVSFSGHFSAGKSSMINTLLGKDILPKSPIPTSANIVKLTSGEGWARVFFANGNPVEYKEPYDLDMIKAYSQNREMIKRIEISTKENVIPAGAALMDTPGIDAADDADRLMTESALHLVDVLFYVMDYNHVQSEVNLYFLKSLQENHIPFYLVINQIDKHNEEELSFASFKESIRQTFANWEISPQDIFYTSLYDLNVENNQFTKVKETLLTILENEDNTYFNIDASVQQVMNNHKVFLEDQYEKLKSEIEIDEELEAQLSEIQAIEDKMTKLSGEPQELEQAFLAELKQTLQNAYLMPKELRDIAEKYLEAEQPGFKVGLFGSKKKTEEEKQERLTSLEHALQNTIESAIQWKLRDKFLQLVKDYEITDSALQEEINGFSISYDYTDLKNLLKSGAKVNGEYVLNYTNDVANDIKVKFKRRSMDLLHTIKEVLQEKHHAVLSSYQSTYEDLQQVKEVKEKYAKIQDELSGKQKNVDETYLHPILDREAWKRAVEVSLNKQKQFIQAETPVEEASKPFGEDKLVVEPKTEPTDLSVAVNADEMTKRIDQAIALTEKLPGFQDLMDDLQTKKDRLANRTFTIALFGAFSAGKSSFSNALIGERILPVSPNPTTATVNRIHPVTEEHPHGTVVVTLKKEEDLYQELLSMTNKFSPKGDNFERLLTWIEKKNIPEHEHLNSMYQAYIKALMTGYPANKQSIGKTVTISLDDFGTYVTDETIACYIETIDLYYDCSITKQGITLVDTPGADSVNARHTNVAFNYIKHADAILYVTYYNHALSRADRDFLMQLGRVKEAFQLDKMFFIVNAADLAENEEELRLVTTYVNDELTKLGIRQAKLFPVSSKLSMEQKLNGLTLNDQMKAFEDSFYSFIHHDLAALTIESALWDMKRVHETMEHYISSLALDQSERAEQKRTLKRDVKEAAVVINDYETVVYEQQIEQRIEKQLYYVIERLGIRYHDMFKEMFNPTTITENGRKANAQLKNALENLLEYIQFELNQELQAVSLRLEGYSLELANEVYRVFQMQSKEINMLFTLPNRFNYELATPEYENKLNDIVKKDFHHILGRYKGTKAFFVQNEKEVMKDELYQVILPAVKAFIHTNQEYMVSGYLQQWRQLMDLMKKSTNDRLHQQVENYFAMLEAPADIEKLNEKLQQMKNLATA